MEVEREIRRRKKEEEERKEKGRKKEWRKGKSNAKLFFFFYLSVSQTTKHFLVDLSTSRPSIGRQLASKKKEEIEKKF